MFVLVFSFFQLNGQVTKIMGKVIDSSTGEPIPFANVFFNGTTIGVTSDFDGNFSLETRTPSDTLVASYMGYYTMEKKISKNKFQVVDFILKPKNFNLTEVVVVAGENPADILLRKIIANKDKNSKEKLDYYQYEVYNKMEVDANNISEKFKNRKLIKPFKFIFENIDTSTINGKTYLPIFLSESLSDYYFRKSPHSEKEIIKAAKTSGVENESVVQFLGNMFQEYSFYNNYIQLFQKN
ncbi:MAG: carboxypeptidase-like regulatory domain-containing protein, partial [Bacteroidetes bacterium]